MSTVYLLRPFLSRFCYQCFVVATLTAAKLERKLQLLHTFPFVIFSDSEQSMCTQRKEVSLNNVYIAPLSKALLANQNDALYSAF